MAPKVVVGRPLSRCWDIVAGLEAAGCEAVLGPAYAPGTTHAFTRDEIEKYLTGETRHFIGAKELALMKPGAYLINTSRGGVVDEDALVAALDHHLGGAALDVWREEPCPPGDPLRTHPRVIATAHNVAHSEELYARLPGAAVENVTRALRGQEPLYVRNPEVLPRWRRRLARPGGPPLGRSLPNGSAPGVLNPARRGLGPSGSGRAHRPR